MGPGALDVDLLRVYVPPELAKFQKHQRFRCDWEARIVMLRALGLCGRAEEKRWRVAPRKQKIWRVAEH